MGTIATRISAISIGLLLPSIAAAATLFFSPASGTFTVGDTFTLSVYTGSADEPMNTAAGTVVFPSEILAVTGISKNGSVMSLWVEEPSFSNENGTVSFEGVALNPGYQGAAGKIITITFRTKTAGNARIEIEDGTVLANDGAGTNILKSIAAANLAVVRGESLSQKATLATLAITSRTHPNQDVWYNIREGEFVWKNPAGTTAVRLGYGTNPNGEPAVLYLPPIEKKELSLDNGIAYFAVQPKTAAGWGAVARYTIRVDTTPPDPFEIEVLQNQTETVPGLIRFSTNDSPSGIDRYEIVQNGKIVKTVSEKEARDQAIELPLVPTGSVDVKVIAYDEAGNTAIAEQFYSAILTPATPSVEEFEYSFSRKDIFIILLTLIVFISALILALWFRRDHLRHLHYDISPEERRRIARTDKELLTGIREMYALLRIEARKLSAEEEKRGLTADEKKLVRFVETTKKAIEEDFPDALKR